MPYMLTMSSNCEILPAARYHNYDMSKKRLKRFRSLVDSERHHLHAWPCATQHPGEK
jgi:hypothetical protein